MTSLQLDLDSLTWGPRGLIPVVAQEVDTGAVLMVAWADREALELTLASRQAHFWSRSRQRLWKKGETSGNVLDVVEVRADCDRDTLLLRVRPRGPACHRGTRTCFEPNAAALELGWLAEVLESRREDSPDSSYTARLLSEGMGRIAQKVGEEATETVVAALAPENPQDRGAELVAEAADLLYHLLVLLEAAGVEPAAVAAELGRRHFREPAGKPDTEDGTDQDHR